MGVMTLRMDDDLARTLAKGDPTRTPRDARPDAAALAMRDQITGVSPSRARVFPRVLMSAAAAIVVIAVAAVTVFFPHAAAYAVTPVPIVFAGGGSTAEVVEMAEGKLATSAGPMVPERGSHTVMWGLSVEPEAQRSAIVPQVTTLSWAEDLSGSFLAVVGEPYWPEGVQPSVDGGWSADPGDVISEMKFAPGEYGTPVVELPGDSRDDVVALLTAFGLPQSPTASEVVQAMTGAFDHWTLTNEQHAQLLALLVDTGGVTVLGSGTDRVGRPVVGLSMKSIFPGVKDLVLISAETGRIVGVESSRVTPDGIVPAGAVISYRMWDTA